MTSFFGQPTLKIPVYDLTPTLLRDYLPAASPEEVRGIHQDAKLMVEMMEDEWRTASEAERQYSWVRRDLRAFRRVERASRKLLDQYWGWI